MIKIQPKDIIAMSVIAAMIIFKITNHNGTLDTVVAVIVGYYFAKRATGEDNGQ
jgi:hypothetical protein